MTEHTSGGQIERYLSRTLAPADILALHNHAETCAHCRNLLAAASLARIPAPGGLLPGAGAEPHLTEEEMVAFVARRMPEPRREEAFRHVAACEVCRDSVAAMKSVRERPVLATIRRSRVPWYAAGAIAAGLLVAVVAQHSRVHPGPAPPAVLASLLDGGQMIELDANGTLRGLEGASPEERSLAREALQRRSLPAGPSLSAASPGVLLGRNAAPPPFSLTAPIDVRVLSDRPMFTWKPCAGAAAYQVVVTNERLDPLARSARITATQWQPQTPLPRGATLLWQVRAWHAGEMVSAPAPPAPPARFQIVEAQVAARLEQLRELPRPSHLLAALLCAREGLRDEAAAELRILAEENPGSPLIASFEGH
jgi:hypothetical protein